MRVEPISDVPGDRSSKKGHWAPVSIARTVSWANSVGPIRIRAATKMPTEFNAQKKALQNRTTTETAKLGGLLPYFSQEGSVTGRSYEVY